MDPKRERPKLQGTELALFDALLAFHVRYLQDRKAVMIAAAREGISYDRVFDIARDVLIYAMPEDLVEQMRTVQRLIDLNGPSKGKPS